MSSNGGLVCPSKPLRPISKAETIARVAKLHSEATKLFKELEAVYPDWGSEKTPMETATSHVGAAMAYLSDAYDELTEA